MGYIQELRALVGHRPLILTGALVLVWDERGRLLLQYGRDSHTWDLPGGFMEFGETVEETARREVREETGLAIGDLKLYRVFSGPEFAYTCPNGDQVVSVIVVFATRHAAGRLQADGVEGLDVRFFPIHELPEAMLPQARAMIRGYLESEGREGCAGAVSLRSG